MLLVHYGADVIKLEPPSGDWSRGLGTRFGSHTALDVACNRGKRSLVLDLKTTSGLAAAQRIAQRVDVVLESFRPGVAQRLGLGYEAMREKNPSVVYLSVSGFGQDGPYSHRAGTDMVMQAFSGMMALNRDASGRPERVGYVVADTATALYAFQAVAMALYGRRVSGQGAYLDVNLMQGSAAFLMPKIIESALEGDTPRALNAPAGSYQTADGWMVITLSKEAHFHGLCHGIGRAELIDDPRFTGFERRADHRDGLVALIQEVLMARKTQDWIEILGQHDVLCNRVNTVGEWIRDPHVATVQGFRPVDVPGMGFVPLAQIPGGLGRQLDGDRWAEIGEHSAEILGEFGFNAQEIQGILGAVK